MENAITKKSLILLFTMLLGKIAFSQKIIGEQKYCLETPRGLKIKLYISAGGGYIVYQDHTERTLLAPPKYKVEHTADGVAYDSYSFAGIRKGRKTGMYKLHITKTQLYLFCQPVGNNNYLEYSGEKSTPFDCF